MKIFKKKRKGNNLVEYGLLAILVGLLIGITVGELEEDSKLTDYFRGAFNNSVSGASSITLDPLTD